MANLAQCHLKLCLYEDTITYCDYALQIDKFHQKSIYKKATSLAQLFKFKESRELFSKIDQGEELSILVDELEAQYNGDYSKVLQDPQGYLNDNKVINYVQGVEIKMT